MIKYGKRRTWCYCCTRATESVFASCLNVLNDMLTPDMVNASSRRSGGPQTKNKGISKQNIFISRHMGSTPRMAILPNGMVPSLWSTLEFIMWMTGNSLSNPED